MYKKLSRVVFALFDDVVLRDYGVVERFNRISENVSVDTDMESIAGLDVGFLECFQEVSDDGSGFLCVSTDRGDSEESVFDVIDNPHGLVSNRDFDEVVNEVREDRAEVKTKVLYVAADHEQDDDNDRGNNRLETLSRVDHCCTLS